MLFRSLVGNLAGVSTARSLPVYLPPQYATEPERRFPVAFYLCGWSGWGRMKIAADKLVGDTANTAVRINLLFNMGRVMQDGAEKKAEPAKTDAYKGSVEPFMAVLKEAPQSEEAPFALQGIATAATMAKNDGLVDAALTVIKDRKSTRLNSSH